MIYINIYDIYINICAFYFLCINLKRFVLVCLYVVGITQCLIEQYIYYTLTIASTYTNNVQSDYVHLIPHSLPKISGLDSCFGPFDVLPQSHTKLPDPTSLPQLGALRAHASRRDFSCRFNRLNFLGWMEILMIGVRTREEKNIRFLTLNHLFVH